MKYQLGFTYEKDGYECNMGSLEYDMDTVFHSIEAYINPREENVTLSVEVYNPYYGTVSDKCNMENKYSAMLEIIEELFVDKFKKRPNIESSNSYGGSDDESITFSYNIKMNENNIMKFINTVKYVNDTLINEMPNSGYAGENVLK